MKILSKKEQKRLEDEEFERVMNEAMAANNAAEQAATTTTAPAATEESKNASGAATAETQAEVDEKKRLAN